MSCCALLRMGLRRWKCRCHPDHESLFGLFPFERDENMFTAGCGNKLGRAFLSRWSEAHFSCFLTEFVDPQVFVALSFPLRRREVDGLGLFCGVDGAISFADLLVFRTK